MILGKHLMHDGSSSREEMRKRLEKKRNTRTQTVKYPTNKWIRHSNTEDEEEMAVGSEGKILLQSTDRVERSGCEGYLGLLQLFTSHAG